MELENFERLEEKITQAIELIGRLKQENQDISSSYRKLAEEKQNFETQAKSSSSEAEVFKQKLASKERDFIQQREEIKKRLQKLMEKLAPFGEWDDGILKNKNN